MSSPANKRMRLSSPTYDAELDDFGVDDLEELDRIEFTLSQQQRRGPVASSSSQRHPSSSQAIGEDAKQRRLSAIMQALQDAGHKDTLLNQVSVDEEHGRDNGLAFKSAAFLPLQFDHEHSKFDIENSSSPVGPPSEKDNLPWSESGGELNAPLPGFQRAGGVLTSLSNDLVDDLSISASPALTGFTSANILTTPRGKALEPSRAALERQKEKMKEWAEEDKYFIEQVVATTSSSPSKSVSGSDTKRPVLASVLNSPSARPTRSPKPRSFSSPSLSRDTAYRPKAFKSPLLGQTPSRTHPKNGVGRTSPSKSGAGTPRSLRQHPLASTPVSGVQSPEYHPRAISDSSLQFTTPARPTAPIALNSISRPSKLTFSTPFKKGMKPGEPGRAVLETTQLSKKIEAPIFQHPRGQSKAERTGKIALKDSGLQPRQYTSDELEDMVVNIAELSQITPQTAPFYVFHATSATPIGNVSSSKGATLGPAEALAHLQKTGRNTTREWVDNHWALVLWKLAGLAALDPSREETPSRRWCWQTVVEQLEARHDREFGKVARPALRLITTGDAPAGSPLVLVVTAILFSEEQRLGNNGRVVQDASAGIEVSDGWYRLRASVDAPLARAVIRGIIKPGRKIAVAGAKLDNDKKDPCEILEAYDSCTLLLCGNGSHLAPWHTKLGFQGKPFIATLGSLTPDGGPIPLVDFIVEKVHPIAYFESLPGSKPGEKVREGPRGEAEEATIEDAWKKRRDAAESKVREELEAHWNRWEGFADRLERGAGVRFNPSADDMQPDHIEELFDELDALPPPEVGSFIRQLGPDECGWLARYLRRRSELDRERAAEEIEIEVNHICPPREVRNFRIVQVRDARTSRRPANRVAHLNIWDVLSLCVSEGGKAGAIEPGQRFLITSLVPMQHNAWMGSGKGDMVYLSTTRNSRFIRLK